MRWILSGLHETGLQLLLGTDSGGGRLEDLTVIREPLGVMAAGRWYSAEALAKLIEIPGSTK